MVTLKDWTARRAGGRITVTGTKDGETFKVVGVDTIKSVPGTGVVATDRTGAQYLLAVAEVIASV